MKNYLILFVIIMSFFISCERKNKNVIEQSLIDSPIKEIDFSEFEPIEQDDVFEFTDRKKAHWNETRKNMYVVNTKGLEERDSPSVDGQVLKTYLYCEMIKVYDKSDETVTIDGITDYWYKCEAYRLYDENEWGEFYSFVFGGHLAEQLPSNAPITILNGYWQGDPKENETISFLFSGNTFVLWENYGECETRGTFSIMGDKLILNLMRGGFYPGAQGWHEFNPVVSETHTFSINNETLKTSEFSIDNKKYDPSKYYLFTKR